MYFLFFENKSNFENRKNGKKRQKLNLIQISMFDWKKACFVNEQTYQLDKLKDAGYGFEVGQIYGDSGDETRLTWFSLNHWCLTWIVGIVGCAILDRNDGL